MGIFHGCSVEAIPIAMLPTWEKPHVLNRSPAQDFTAKLSGLRNLKLVVLLEQVAGENKTSLLSKKERAVPGSHFDLGGKTVTHLQT